jgi:hypothetical protein
VKRIFIFKFFIPLDQFPIGLHAPVDLVPLLRRKGLDDFGRVAGHHHIGRDAEIGFYDGAGGDDDVIGADYPGHQNGPHTHQDIVPDNHIVNNSSVGDDYLSGNFIGFLNPHMEDAVFLKAGAGTHADPAKVPAQNGPGTDKTFLTDSHIPDEGGLGMDVGRRVDYRKFVFKRVEGHDFKSVRGSRFKVQGLRFKV